MSELHVVTDERELIHEELNFERTRWMGAVARVERSDGMSRDALNDRDNFMLRIDYLLEGLFEHMQGQEDAAA